MNSFVFETAPRIVCADGVAETVGALARDISVSRAFVVTDQGLLRSGVLELALASLESSGIEVVLFSDVQADPPEGVILAAVQRARDECVDGVIGIGGGSSLDTAKLVAQLVSSNAALNDGFLVVPKSVPRRISRTVHALTPDVVKCVWAVTVSKCGQPTRRRCSGLLVNNTREVLSTMCRLSTARCDQCY